MLLIKEWSNNKNAYLWNIVKGTFDSSLDKTLVDCATREAQEEAGVKVELSNFLSLSVKHGHSVRIYVNFVGKITEGEPTLTSKDEQDKRGEDIKEVVWKTKNELQSMKEEEFISDVVYESIQKWLKGEVYPVSILEEKILAS